MKILYFGDAPLVTTGLAQVSRTIVHTLMHEHDVEVIAMNYWEDQHHDTSDLPYKIHPCVSQNYRNVESAKETILKADYDMFIYSADVGFTDIFIWLMEAKQKRDFFIVAYVPVDCDTIHASAFNCLELCNVVITYTEHGKGVITRYKPELADRVNVIPLVCEPHLYFPLEEKTRHKLRKEIFNVDSDTFLVGCVARNQPRKDLGRLLLCFHEYYKTHPDSVLYVHSAQNDLGGSLVQTAMSLDMQIGTEILFTSPSYNVCQGLPSTWMNCFYNCFNLLTSCTTGEGWGIPTTEAMCAGTPVCMPRNTANIEIIGPSEERGFFIETGGDLDHQQFLYGLVNYPRDIIHSTSFLNTLDYIQKNRHVAEHRAVKAIEWCEQHTIKQIAPKWLKLAKTIEQIGVTS